jgi:arginyl-tRNA synthetase
LNKILTEKEHFGDVDTFKGQKILVEFISANPTGPLTLANGRGGFAGDVLANLFTKAGAKVEREYYVNDGGNQINVLNNSIYASITKGMVGNPSKEVQEMYLGQYIEDFASEIKAEAEKKYGGDKVYSGEIDWYKEIEPYKPVEKILDSIKNSVNKMGINFDRYFSEKEMIDKGEVEEAIDKLKYFKHTKEDEGALWFKTTEFGDDKDRVLIKADGEKTYFANDVAYHFDKIYKRGFDLLIDFWGADHHGYIDRMQAAISAMGCPGKLQIVIMQMVRLIQGGKELKMSKRKGTYVTMDDLLELIGGTEKEASDVARFFFLMYSFNTHMDFNLDLAKEHSDKNPIFYVKYAYARLSGILRNAEKLSLPKPNLELLKTPEELDLIKELISLPSLVENILTKDDYPVHQLTYYSREIASKFHAFYDKFRVIDEDDLELTVARIQLVVATKIVLGIALTDLLGVEAPERM